MSISSWIGSIVLCLGLSFLCFGAYNYWKIYKFKGEASETKGYVVELTATRERYPRYAPNVSYDLPDGRRLLYHHEIFSRPSEYSVGETVTIFYDPRHPEQVRMADDYFSVYILGGLGAAFTFFGSLFLGSGRKGT